MLIHKYLAAAVGALSSVSFVAADKDCCYRWVSAKKDFEILVSWDALTGEGSCFTKYWDGIASCNVVTNAAESRYLEATATAFDRNGQSFQWLFGMNNNACLFLHDNQIGKVATSFITGLSENGGANYHANGKCPTAIRREIGAPKHPRDFSAGTTDLVVRDETPGEGEIYVVLKYITTAGVELLAKVILDMSAGRIVAPLLGRTGEPVPYKLEDDHRSITVNVSLIKGGTTYLLHGVFRMIMANPMGWVDVASSYLEQASLQISGGPVRQLGDHAIIVSPYGDTAP